MNRRKFLFGMAAVASLPFIPKLPVPAPPSVSTIVSATMRRYAPRIAANVSANNALLIKLLEERIMNAETAMRKQLEESLWLNQS